MQPRPRLFKLTSEAVSLCFSWPIAPLSLSTITFLLSVAVFICTMVVEDMTGFPDFREPLTRHWYLDQSFWLITWTLIGLPAWCLVMSACFARIDGPSEHMFKYFSFAKLARLAVLGILLDVLSSAFEVGIYLALGRWVYEYIEPFLWEIVSAPLLLSLPFVIRFDDSIKGAVVASWDAFKRMPLLFLGFIGLSILWVLAGLVAYIIGAGITLGFVAMTQALLTVAVRPTEKPRAEPSFSPYPRDSITY